jgi:LPP20 lipoprotein
MKHGARIGMGLFMSLGPAAVLLLVTGCAQQKPMGQEEGGMARVDTPLQDVKGLPEWVNNKGAAFSGERRVLHGVGSASGLRNPSLRRKAAEGQARNDMAASLQVYVASLQKQYMAETTAGDMSRQEVEQHIQDTMKQVTEATLVGVQIVEIWENPLRNETYALARLDMEQFLEIMKSYKSATAGFAQLDANLRDWVRNNANKAHDQLDEELQKRKQ